MKQSIQILQAGAGDRAVRIVLQIDLQKDEPGLLFQSGDHVKVEGQRI